MSKTTYNSKGQPSVREDYNVEGSCFRPHYDKVTKRKIEGSHKHIFKYNGKG